MELVLARVRLGLHNLNRQDVLRLIHVKRSCICCRIRLRDQISIRLTCIRRCVGKCTEIDASVLLVFSGSFSTTLYGICNSVIRDGCQRESELACCHRLIRIVHILIELGKACSHADR